MDLLVGWCEFACLMKVLMSGLLMSHRENMLPMYNFQIVALTIVLFGISG